MIGEYPLGTYYNGTGKIKIPGLNGLGPFKAALWARHTVYSTDSLWESKLRRAPWNPPYICKRNYDDPEIRIFGRRDLVCLGKFISLMSDDEKALVEENIDEIMNVLGIL
jgi:hypothetical protein